MFTFQGGARDNSSGYDSTDEEVLPEINYIKRLSDREQTL